MRSPRGFSVKYTSRVNILRRGLRGSHHIHVAADTDTLFTLHEPAQILRQVERATKVFSQYPPPSHGGKGVERTRSETGLGDVRTRKGRFAIQWCCSSRKKKAEGRKEGGGRGSESTSRRNMSPTYVALVTNFGRQRACVLLHTET